ncbi:MAG: carbohydrate ABC transporter permease [Chloroflexota bacterium]
MKTPLSESALNYAILSILALIVIFPLLGMATLAFQPEGLRAGQLTFPPSFTLDTILHAWEAGSFATALRSSAVTAGSTTVITVTVAVLAGYAFGTMRMRFSSILFSLFLAGLIVPLEAYVVPLYYQLRTMSLLDTLPGLVGPLSAHLLPFGIFWMRAQFRTTPRALIEAAQLDGAGSWAVLRYVLLPIARPAISSLGVLTFLWAWNDFLLTLIVISSNDLRTAPLQLGLFVGVHSSDTSALAAAALIVSVPVLVIYVLFQRQLIQGLLEGGVKE